MIDLIFRPPPMPPIELPLIARAAGTMKAIQDAFNLAYWAGVKDGVVWGLIAALAVALICSSLSRKAAQ